MTRVTGGAELEIPRRIQPDRSTNQNGVLQYNHESQLRLLQANLAHQPLEARIRAQGIKAGFDRQHD